MGMGHELLAISTISCGKSLGERLKERKARLAVWKWSRRWRPFRADE